MRCLVLRMCLAAATLCVAGSLHAQSPAEPLETPVSGAEREPLGDRDLEFWLQNMVWYHRYSLAEMTAATGLDAEQLRSSMRRLDISLENGPDLASRSRLVVMPYPGGRHPRIGFREGAIRPQRETKFSVFLPWDPSSYVVVDVPEALWSDLGLTYLAHTHIDTIWSKQGIELPPLEWRRSGQGDLDLTRRLPNGIKYTARVRPAEDHVWMELTLTNGTDQTLSDLRVQNCVMLREARGFEAQTNDNKILAKPYAVCRNGNRWVITAWTPCHRSWANQRCPCLHSDPKFPDCPPGETRRLVGWLSFFEGEDIESELKRIDRTGWQQRQSSAESQAGTDR